MSDKKSCSKIEERSVIKFLVAEECKTVENHRRMSIVYARPNHQSLISWEALWTVWTAETGQKYIKNKRGGHQSKGVILHYDNARPHTAAQTVQTINNLGWEMLPHPAYSPDLASANFHLFCPMKVFTRGTKFESEDEVKSFVSDYWDISAKIFMLREYGSLCTNGKNMWN